MSILYIFLYIILAANHVAGTIQCLDNNKKPVDWFVFYKLPRLFEKPGNFPISNGTAFIYLDVNDKNWKLMDDGLDMPDNAIYNTLQQFYSANSSETFSYLYNDEWPDSDEWSEVSGHAKGVTVFDQYTGFWLIHSIPKFPSTVEFRFPRNAHWYGQMGICVSFPFVALQNIANQLYYYNTFTYHFNMPDEFATSVPLLRNLSNGEWRTTPPYTKIAVLKSLGGQSFKHFAKTGPWGKDLYANLVVPEVLSSMKVETWNHESGNERNLPSECAPTAHQSTLNAKHIRLPIGVNFSTHDDHSKYAVTYSESSFPLPNPIVCIGDINRQTHQLHRGGGTLCLLDQAMYSQFSTIITDTVPCSATRGKVVEAMEHDLYMRF